MCDHELIVRGPPPRKNERHRTVVGRDGKPRRINTERYNGLVGAVAMEWGRPLRIESGVWSLTIVAYWGRRSRKIEGVPHADADAPISCVMDALQESGVIDNDMRIKCVSASKAYDKANPRTVIQLTRIR